MTPTDASPSAPPGDVVIEAESVSKLFRLPAGRRTPVPVPSVFPWRKGSRSLAPAGRREEIVDEDDFDADDIEDDLEEDEEEPKAEKKPREIWALKDVSFRVLRGSVVGVIGGNGAGKSTLLKVITRMTVPTSGVVHINGRVSPALTTAAAFLQGEWSGRRNVFTLAALLGVPREIAERRVDEIIAFAEVGDLADTMVKRYSSGQGARLGFSAALHLEPDVVVSDGRLVVGDRAFREKCMAAIEARKQAGMTMLLASADMGFVANFCDVAMWLDQGELRAMGPPDSVIEQYEAETPTGRPGRTGQKKGDRSTSDDVSILGATTLASDGSELSIINIREACRIRIELDIPSSGVEVQCAVALVEHGTTLMRIIQPVPLPVALAGRYAASVELPGGLLPEAALSGRIRAKATKDGQSTVVRQEGAFEIEVYDTASGSGDSADSTEGDVFGVAPDDDETIDETVPAELLWRLDPVPTPDA